MERLELDFGDEKVAQDEELYNHILHTFCIFCEEKGIKQVLLDLERIQQNYKKVKE